MGNDHDTFPFIPHEKSFISLYKDGELKRPPGSINFVISISYHFLASQNFRSPNWLIWDWRPHAACRCQFDTRKQTKRLLDVQINTWRKSS